MFMYEKRLAVSILDLNRSTLYLPIYTFSSTTFYSAINECTDVIFIWNFLSLNDIFSKLFVYYKYITLIIMDSSFRRQVERDNLTSCPLQ